MQNWITRGRHHQQDRVAHGQIPEISFPAQSVGLVHNVYDCQVYNDYHNPYQRRANGYVEEWDADVEQAFERRPVRRLEFREFCRGRLRNGL